MFLARVYPSVYLGFFTQPTNFGRARFIGPTIVHKSGFLLQYVRTVLRLHNSYILQEPANAVRYLQARPPPYIRSTSKSVSRSVFVLHVFGNVLVQMFNHLILPCVAAHSWVYNGCAWSSNLEISAPISLALTSFVARLLFVYKLR